MQSQKRIAQDFAEQRDDTIYRTAKGREFRHGRPGRKRLLSADKASLVFELQVQIRAAEKRIHRIMDEAGVSNSLSRGRILRLNWMDRGRVDIVHQPKSKVAP